MKMRKARHAIVETMRAHANVKSRGIRLVDRAEHLPA